MKKPLHFFITHYKFTKIKDIMQVENHKKIQKNSVQIMKYLQNGRCHKDLESSLQI